MSNKIYTIEEIKAMLKKILYNTPVCQVILFGSYAKQNASKKSDLDFIIDSKGALMGFSLLELIEKIEKNYGQNKKSSK